MQHRRIGGKYDGFEKINTREIPSTGLVCSVASISPVNMFFFQPPLPVCVCVCILKCFVNTTRPTGT